MANHDFYQDAKIERQSAENKKKKMKNKWKQKLFPLKKSIKFKIRCLEFQSVLQHPEAGQE